MSNTTPVHIFTRTGRARPAPEAKARRVQQSNALRRAIVYQRSFIPTERVPAADEFSLLDVLNAMAVRPRHPDTIDCAIVAVHAQLHPKKAPSIYDTDLRHFVIRYEWQFHSEFVPAMTALLVAVRAWETSQHVTKKE